MLMEEVSSGPWLSECGQQLREAINQSVSKSAVLTASGRKAMQNFTCIDRYLHASMWDTLSEASTHTMKAHCLGVRHPSEQSYQHVVAVFCTASMGPEEALQMSHALIVNLLCSQRLPSPLLVCWSNRI